MIRPRALLICLAMLVPSPARAAGPVVERVGPPSWWSAPARQSLTLLVEGSGLAGARVTSSRPGVEVVRVESPSPGGSALFVELALAAGVAPGPSPLEVEAAGGRARVDWAVEPRHDRRPATLGPDDVLYLAMPDRFADGDPANNRAGMADPMLDRADPHAYHGGDFAGLRARLPYLVDLGVTALWLTPIYKAAPTWHATKDRKYADFHGYSPVDFYETNPRFGTRAEYRALVDEAHRLGLKVVQDHVVGHVGPQHPWASRPPAPGWFHGPMDHPPSCNFRFDALTNPHAPESLRRGLTDGWFFGILPDLDLTNDRVRRYATQQSLWWAETFEADAIRLDTYPMVDRAFWRDWSAARKAMHPEWLAIGEAWTTDPADLSFFQGGRVAWDGVDPGVESVFDFPLNAALAEVARGKAPASRLAQALGRDFLYPRPDLLMTFLDNHDMPRLAATPGLAPARYRLAAAFLLTTRGIPQLTWGDEVGLPGHGDDRRPIPGGWPGDPRDAFAQAGRTPEERATFDAFRALLALRKASPALRGGTTTELAATPSAFAYLREGGGERAVVALNFGDAPATLDLPVDPAGFAKAYGEGRASAEARAMRIEVPAVSAVVFRR